MRREELNQMGMVPLAVICGKIAHDSATEATIAEKAGELKHEWAMLVAQQTPPPSDHNEMTKLENKQATLRKRMIDFLSVAG
jgi:hypothetical protein